MAKAAVNIRSLARSHSTTALDTLAGIARCGENEGARVQAAIALLDRGWGKPPQTHTGEDGEGDIRVTIRHIIQGALPEPKLVEGSDD